MIVEFEDHPGGSVSRMSFKSSLRDAVGVVRELPRQLLNARREVLIRSIGSVCPLRMRHGIVSIFWRMRTMGPTLPQTAEPPNRHRRSETRPRRRLRCVSFVALVLGSSCSWWIAPSTTFACSYGHWVQLAVPVAGATEIPTDVRPWLQGGLWDWEVSLEVVLEGPDGPVDHSLRHHAGPDSSVGGLAYLGVTRRYVEIVPEALLTPETTYTITVRSTHYLEPEIWRSSFTTGAGPSSSAPAPLRDVAFEIATTSHRPDDPCSNYPDVVCLGIPEDRQFEAHFRVGDALESGWTMLGMGPFNLDIVSAERAEPFCVDLYPRNFAGTLGEPLTLCSADVDARSFDHDLRGSSCTPDGLTVVRPDAGIGPPNRNEAGAAGPTSSGAGCSVQSRSPSAGGAAWFILVAWLIGRHRRPRRARRA